MIADLEDLKVLIELITSYKNAIDNGDGEYEVIYEKLIREYVAGFKIKYPEMDSIEDRIRAEIWKKYYKGL